MGGALAGEVGYDIYCLKTSRNDGAGVTGACPGR